MSGVMIISVRYLQRTRSSSGPPRIDVCVVPDYWRAGEPAVDQSLSVEVTFDQTTVISFDK